MFEDISFPAKVYSRSTGNLAKSVAKKKEIHEILLNPDKMLIRVPGITGINRATNTVTKVLFSNLDSYCFIFRYFSTAFLAHVENPNRAKKNMTMYAAMDPVRMTAVPAHTP